VGRLVEMKGREYAIRAVAQLKDQYPIQYDIIGDGPLHNDLQRLIDELNANDTIKLHGWVASETLDEMYSQAHLFVHPSVTSSDGNQEGQGVVLLEAQAHGLPVIATWHGAFPDSVQEGKTALLVPERDVLSLTLAIEKLIQNNDQWPVMGTYGREFVENRFAENDLTKKLLNIYTTILKDC
jgi:colanic acid/amylovoran biosynthesis glycosyltransferase